MRTGLSIIIPCLDEAVGIVAALERLQPLRARGAEVIVVDGGSADATITLAAQRADRLVVAARGRAAQMNAGAAVARGDVLLFLHADCVLPSLADHLIIDGLTSSGKQWGRFDVDLSAQHFLLHSVGRMMNLRSRLTSVATGDQGIFVRKDLFFALGGFPPIPLMEDIAMSKRLKTTGSPLCLRSRITASARRWQRNGVLRTIVLMWRLRLAFFLGADPVKLAFHYGTVRAKD